MNRFKSNKGISLASVLVTVVIMIIILTSIIYSRGQTNEVKKAMLLNSDIEELTKKVEVYYLEKQTLPMLEDSSSAFKYIEEGETADDKTPVYYKLQISLLDNLTLNNKEIIYKEEKNERTPGDQWYVINKETHTIYFVKDENGKVVPQEAKYSSEYDSIIIGATEGDNKIKFNQSEATSTQVSEETTIVPAEDKIIEDTSGLGVGRVEGENGTNTSPEEISGSGTAHYTYANYIGWDKTGTTATNLVLQYDGEYNAGKTGDYHNSSTTTWIDLTGNGYDGTITSGNWKTVYHETTNSTVYNNGFIPQYSNFGKSTEKSRSAQAASFDSNCLYLNNDTYVYVDGYGYDDNNKINNSNILSTIPSGSNKYTMEIVFYYNGNNARAGLIGMGTYNNHAFSEDTDQFKKVLIVNYSGSSVDHWSTTNLDKKNQIKTEKRNVVNNVLAWFEQNNGKSNAIRINNNGNGITSYYWGENENEDIDTGDKLSEGIHTVTVEYDGNMTKIYIDAILMKEENKIPNTKLRELTVGATNMQTIAEYRDHKTSTGRVYAQANRYYYYAYNNQSNKVVFTHQYTEFLNSNVYSVRIYNRALSSAEVKYNYITDYYRFGSGT